MRSISGICSANSPVTRSSAIFGTGTSSRPPTSDSRSSLTVVSAVTLWDHSARVEPQGPQTIEPLDGSAKQPPEDVPHVPVVPAPREAPQATENGSAFQDGPREVTLQHRHTLVPISGRCDNESPPDPRSPTTSGRP